MWQKSFQADGYIPVNEENSKLYAKNVTYFQATILAASTHTLKMKQMDDV